jgi:D-beta-D-heptose 7-phosphate kinase/D-beta-D-heptose 1-phosphate adenosyltransferase
MELLENFPKVKVLVIGDVMLDRYCWGSVRRISPEAPVPVVTLNQTTLVAGGAANVAANVAGLGATPFLVGIVGTDAEAEILSAVLANVDVSPKFLIPIKKRQTTVKTRIIAHQQQVVRLDQENTKPLSQQDVEVVLKRIEKIWDEIEIVIISDYAKGFLTEEFLARLIITANQNRKIVLVDPKGQNYSKYKGAALLTPNQSEAAVACKLEEDEQNIVEKAGNKLLVEIKAKSVLITQGENGMTLFQKGQKSIKIKAAARKVYDITGAGDTVISCLAVALAAGADLVKAAKISNIAAGAVVEYIGTTAITRKMLENALIAENL